MKKNQLLFPVTILLANVVAYASSEYYTRNWNPVSFDLQKITHLEIGFRRTASCKYCTCGWWIFSSYCQCGDDKFRIQLDIGGRANSFSRVEKVECSTSEWTSVTVERKNLKLNGRLLHSISADEIRHGVTLKLSSKYGLTWMTHAEEVRATTPAPKPTVNVPVLSGSIAGGIVFISVIAFVCVILYRKRRANYGTATDDNTEEEDYQDVVNFSDAIYMDITNEAPPVDDYVEIDPIYDYAEPNLVRDRSYAVNSNDATHEDDPIYDNVKPNPL